MLALVFCACVACTSTDCEFTDASMDSAVMIYQTFFNFHSQVMAVLKGNKVYDIDVEAFAKRLVFMLI